MQKTIKNCLYSMIVLSTYLNGMQKTQENIDRHNKRKSVSYELSTKIDLLEGVSSEVVQRKRFSSDEVKQIFNAESPLLTLSLVDKKLENLKNTDVQSKDLHKIIEQIKQDLKAKNIRVDQLTKTRVKLEEFKNKTPDMFEKKTRLQAANELVNFYQCLDFCIRVIRETEEALLR